MPRQNCASFGPKWGHFKFLEACPAKTAHRLVPNGVISNLLKRVPHQNCASFGPTWGHFKFLEAHVWEILNSGGVPLELPMEVRLGILNSGVVPCHGGGPNLCPCCKVNPYGGRLIGGRHSGGFGGQRPPPLGNHAPTTFFLLTHAQDPIAIPCGGINCAYRLTSKRVLLV